MKSEVLYYVNTAQQVPVKVGDKSLINSQIGLHEVPAKLNFEGETSEVLLSSQAHFVMCLG